MAKKIDVEAYKRWKEYCDSIRKATDVNPDETFGEKQARIKRLEADDEAWFLYYFPHVSTNPVTGEITPPAPFHKKATVYLQTNVHHSPLSVLFSNLVKLFHISHFSSPHFLWEGIKKGKIFCLVYLLQ